MQKCHGDCDHDEDCADGLVCFQRMRNETVPGCVGFALDFFDYCVEPDAEIIESEEQNILPPAGLLSMVFSDGSDSSVLPLQVRVAGHSEEKSGLPQLFSSSSSIHSDAMGIVILMKV